LRHDPDHTGARWFDGVLLAQQSRTRDALVADVPGLTRDRKYGYVRHEGRSCVVIDTGGLVESIVGGIERLMAEQTLKAVDEADRVLFVVDSREGCTPQDLHVADLLRRSGKSVIVVANKAEGLDDDMAQAEFHRFGFGEPNRSDFRSTIRTAWDIRIIDWFYMHICNFFDT
jgi:GTP-binding protein